MAQNGSWNSRRSDFWRIFHHVDCSRPFNHDFSPWMVNSGEISAVTGCARQNVADMRRNDCVEMGPGVTRHRQHPPICAEFGKIQVKIGQLKLFWISWYSGCEKHMTFLLTNFWFSMKCQVPLVPLFFVAMGCACVVFQERSQEANHALQGFGEAAGGEFLKHSRFAWGKPGKHRKPLCGKQTHHTQCRSSYWHPGVFRGNC